MSSRSRHTGTVTAWNVDRGFGFAARAGEPDLFVHIKAFPRGTAAPVPGDVITFEVEAGPDGKLRAAHAAPSGVPFIAPLRPTSPAIGLLAIVAFAAIYVLVEVFWTQLPLWVLALYVGLSIIAFFAYGADKDAARSSKRRIAETTLILLGLLGGWPGAIIGQQVFRHKTAKRSFRAVFWVSVLINVFVFAVLSAPGVGFAIVDLFG
ncbi:MAG TPA: DUF1294 domain-containing protein [Pseudolysinimonas sp.]|nr:DUF1294 domain-containing protein [Pseudolysinimonas sp.]